MNALPIRTARAVVHLLAGQAVGYDAFVGCSFPTCDCLVRGRCAAHDSTFAFDPDHGIVTLEEITTP